MTAGSALAKIQPYLVEKPRPLIGAETVQLVVMREILDYTILRTEDTRELNTVHTPASINRADDPIRRVAFLASKQKAAESRELEYLLRTASRRTGLSHEECYLKDNLCMKCPRCGLYGGTRTVSGQNERANIKHRIEYSTAYSLLPFEEIATAITFNAMNDRNQTTGQALGQRFAVQPATLFPSIITLKSATERELILTIKALLSCKSYGAETRIGGDIRNTIWGIIAGWEEIITSLELTLELADKMDGLNSEEINQLVMDKYRHMSGNPNHIVVLEPDDVDEVVRHCSETDLDREFLEGAFQDVADYRGEQLAR